MGDEEEPRLSPTARQVLGKTRIPHKFCPYCGQRNEASAETCENCGKNIAWMKIPEPMPAMEIPPQKPRDLPEQRKAFSRRTLIIILIILALIIIAILTVALTVGKSKGAAAGIPFAVMLVSRPIDTVTHRERQCAAPARRATEAYSCSTARERNAAGVDAGAFECHCIYGTGH